MDPKKEWWLRLSITFDDIPYHHTPRVKNARKSVTQTSVHHADGREQVAHAQSV